MEKGKLKRAWLQDENGNTIELDIKENRVDLKELAPVFSISIKKF